MDRTTKVCEVVERLYEELDGPGDTLTSLQTGAVIRGAAELVVEEINEERSALLAYLEHHHPHDVRLRLLISACQQGVHRRRASQSMEAVVGRRG